MTNSWPFITQVTHISKKSKTKKGKEELRTVAKVFYVDFGNTETIDIRRILPIPLEHATTPGQAVKCAMYNTRPIASDDGECDWTRS